MDLIQDDSGYKPSNPQHSTVKHMLMNRSVGCFFATMDLRECSDSDAWSDCEVGVGGGAQHTEGRGLGPLAPGGSGRVRFTPDVHVTGVRDPPPR